MSNYQSVARTSPRALSRAIQAGIPAALRGMMWQLMSSSKNEEMEIIYAYYLKQNSPHEKAIRRDLNRTFPEQDYFQDRGVGQENLYNVIKAYSCTTRRWGTVRVCSLSSVRCCSICLTKRPFRPLSG